ncbi:glycosyltransferase family 2 protein [Synechococcus sp. MIT S9508]|uniref:glycosyltransferase family 2 protein n=1 Tax=Synechococcus sp. MIT S9508 TaxID=1801629 RepID=UPI0007BC4AC9|nr:glycosyltransferase [Synechococcus sp. MIT S9508]KZR90637.1 putative glycosyl transferase [Synechococcus sp. MIT S9508]
MTTELDIIIPVYNDQEGLNNTLASIENQNVSKELIRVLVVDNDSSPAIQIPPTSFEVHLLHCDQTGSYAARNTALTKVQSKIVAFTDADCILDRNWVKTGIQNINITSKQLSKPGILAGEISIIPSKQPETSADLADIHFGMTQKKFVNRGRYGITANLWARSEDLVLLSGFNESLKSGGDRDFCLRAQQQLNASLIYDPDCIVYHPARSKKEQIIKSKRLLGGQFDRAKGNHAKEIAALFLHLRPLIKETLESLMIPVSAKRRLALMFFVYQIRFSTISEWIKLFLRKKKSSRL